MSDFLACVERRAFKQCVYAVQDDEAALDIVQDSMMKLAEKYSERPAAEIPLLFQRILQNGIRDHFRRSKVRSTWTTLLSNLGLSGEDDDADPLETLDVEDGGNMPGIARGPARAVPGDGRHRGGGAGPARPSTRGIHAALLGGTRRERDGQGDGMLGRQR